MPFTKLSEKLGLSAQPIQTRFDDRGMGSLLGQFPA